MGNNPYLTKIVDDCDIYQYPDSRRVPAPHEEFTLGDLHGNTMKLIYFLIRNGLMDLKGGTLQEKKKKYARLVAIYQTDVNALTVQDIADFETTLQEAEFSNNQNIIRLLGDEINDRGNNDYFTVLTFDTILGAQFDLRILFSNHGRDGIYLWKKTQKDPNELSTKIQIYQNHPDSNEANNDQERVQLNKLEKETVHTPNKKFLSPYDLHYKSQIRSMLNFGRLLYRRENQAGPFLLNQKKVNGMMNAYFSRLRLLDYTLSDDKTHITLYSHAGINVDVISYLANKLKVSFNDDTAEALAETIERINAAFQIDLNGRQELLKSMHTGGGCIYSQTGALVIDPKINPLAYLIWNTQPVNRSEFHKGYRVSHSNGHHTPTEPVPDYVYILNDKIGQKTRPPGGIGPLVDLHQATLTTLKATPAGIDQTLEPTTIDQPSQQPLPTNAPLHKAPKTPKTAFFKRHPILKKALLGGLIGLGIIIALAASATVLALTCGAATPIILGATMTVLHALPGVSGFIAKVTLGAGTGASGALIGGTIGSVMGAKEAKKREKAAQDHAPIVLAPSIGTTSTTTIFQTTGIPDNTSNQSLATTNPSNSQSSTSSTPNVVGPSTNPSNSQPPILSSRA